METNKHQIMRDIETKTEKLVVQILQREETLSKNTNELCKTSDTLREIMDTGAKEFEQRVGRPMTYCEMRSMFG